jgi:hypothetical protein
MITGVSVRNALVHLLEYSRGMAPADQNKAALDELMVAFLASVSFEEGDKPEYDRIRTLFIERGLLIKNIGGVTETCDVDEFIAPRRELVYSGALTQFRETEDEATTSIFGAVGHRWSVYSKSGVHNGEPFSARGIIFTQFVRSSDSWLISSMAWDDEGEGLTLEDAAVFTV